jgi:hypothetical protein
LYRITFIYYYIHDTRIRQSQSAGNARRCHPTLILGAITRITSAENENHNLRSPIGAEKNGKKGS